MTDLEAAEYELVKQFAAWQQPGDFCIGEVLYAATGVEPTAEEVEAADAEFEEELDRCARDRDGDQIDVAAIVEASKRGGKFQVLRSDGTDASGWVEFATALERFYALRRRRIDARIVDHRGYTASPTTGQIDLTGTDR